MADRDITLSIFTTDCYSCRFNEERRLQERRLKFNVHELANVICRTVGKPLGDLEAIERFAEGGFNRILQATFNDKREVLVRLPFRLDAPLRHSVASEAATLSFLRDRGIPVPSVLAYSASSDNPVGIEYIVLEKMQGQPLGDRWFSLENKAVAKIMKQIVDIERDYMALELPACGSLYFASDLTAEQSVPLGPALGGHFAVGPIASYAWEYRERANLTIDRGPCEYSHSRLVSSCHCLYNGREKLRVVLSG